MRPHVCEHLSDLKLRGFKLQHHNQHPKMRFLRSLLPSLLLVGASVVDAASSWTFEDASVSVSGKGGVGSGSKDKYALQLCYESRYPSTNATCIRLSEKTPLSKPVTLGAFDTLKILLTATENGKPKRPHQAFLLLTDQDTGLETSFPLSVKDSGKGKVDFVRSAGSIDI